MKTINRIRLEISCLLMAGLLAVSLSACDWEREEDSQRENEADSLGQLDDRFKIEDAEVARERATFEENMHQTVTTYAQQVQDLKASVAELPEQKQQEGKQMVAELEKKLAEFEEQIAGMEKAEGMRWADYRKILLGSSLDIKGHLNRAEELMDPEEAQAEAESQ